MSDPAAPEQAPPPKKTSVGSLLILGIGGALVAAVLAALILPAIAAATARARVTSCMSNLRQLYTMQTIYASQFGGENREFPAETGSAFWLKLTRTTPPLLDPTEFEVLLCPVRDKFALGTCDYLGPSAPVQTLAGGDAVGADRRGNHRKGGNVIRKSGDVLELLDADFFAVCDRLSP